MINKNIDILFDVGTKKKKEKRNCHASLKKDCEPGFGLKPHSRELMIVNEKEEERIKYKIINAISVMYTFREKKIHNMINYNKRISNTL